jgi:hypothetical protein
LCDEEELKNLFKAPWLGEHEETKVLKIIPTRTQKAFLLRPWHLKFTLDSKNGRPLLSFHSKLSSSSVLWLSRVCKSSFPCVCKGSI